MLATLREAVNRGIPTPDQRLIRWARWANNGVREQRTLPFESRAIPGRPGARVRRVGRSDRRFGRIGERGDRGGFAYHHSVAA